MTEFDKQYLTPRDKIRNEALKKSNEIFGTPYTEMNEYNGAQQSEYESIMQALAYVLNKLTHLDDYVRNHRYPDIHLQKRMEGK